MTEPAQVLEFRRKLVRPGRWHRPARVVLREMGIEGEQT